MRGRLRRQGREWWLNDEAEPGSGGGGKELEHWLGDPPFEAWPLFRGAYHADPAKSSRRRVGTFKGHVRVTLDDPRLRPTPKPSPFNAHNRALGRARADGPANLPASALFAVRLYVVRGKNVQPVGGGKMSDPYLRVKLGETTINDKASLQKHTTEPDFYKQCEAFVLQAVSNAGSNPQSPILAARSRR